MKTKTAEEIMAKINPSTPHSLTVWTDEMVIQAMHEYASQVAEAVELSQLLFDCNQVLTGYAMDDSWSEWDESVRQRVIKMQYDINQPSSRHQENGDFYCADWNRCGSICDEQCPACKKAENAPEILPDSPASPVDGREAVR